MSNNDSFAVSVGTSAATVVAAEAGQGLGKPRQVTVHNAHASNTLYIGASSSVATSDGMPIEAGNYKVFILNYNDELHGIASGASTDVRVFVVHGKGDPS